jgi:hypothetical protein
MGSCAAGAKLAFSFIIVYALHHVVHISISSIPKVTPSIYPMSETMQVSPGLLVKHKASCPRLHPLDD